VCNYDLQVRALGSAEYKTTTKVSNDRPFRAYGRLLTPAEFKSENNIFLIEPSQFVGKRLLGSWRGLTVMPPGRYEIRVVYRGLDNIPVAFERPFFSATLIPNVVQVEVLP